MRRADSWPAELCRLAGARRSARRTRLTATPACITLAVETGGMAQLVNTLDAWISGLFEMLSSWIGACVTLLEGPAQAIGIPAGVFAAAILLAVLVIAWRSMSRYIM
jgi:hypothetical protein